MSLQVFAGIAVLALLCLIFGHRMLSWLPSKYKIAPYAISVLYLAAYIMATFQLNALPSL